MTSDNRNLLGAGAIAVAIPVALGLGLGWSAWVWLPLAAALLAAVWLGDRWLADRRKQGKVRELLDLTATPRPAEPQEIPTRTDHVADVPLASAEPDYPLIFGATVHWRPVHVYLPHADPSGLATDALLQRAWAITVESSPADHPLMRHRLAAELGTAAKDASGQVEVWATDVTLTVHERDAERLGDLSDVRKQEHVWERERALERAMRAYLTEDVLTSTGSAVVWWLARHPEDVERAVDLIGTMSTLTATAQGAEPPPDPQLTDDQRRDLFSQLLVLLGDVRRQLDGPRHAHEPTIPTQP